VTLSLPSQLPLRHQPSVPVVPQGFDFPLLLLLHLEQADPLGDPVRGDSVPLSKLDTCKVVHEHLCLQFPGENDRVTVRAPGLLRLHNYVGTGYCQGVRFAGKGSTERKTGVSGVPGSSSLRGGQPLTSKHAFSAVEHRSLCPSPILSNPNKVNSGCKTGVKASTLRLRTLHAISSTSMPDRSQTRRKTLRRRPSSPLCTGFPGSALLCVKLLHLNLLG